MSARRLYRPPRPSRLRDTLLLPSDTATVAAGPLAADTFTRANAAALGTSSSGHAWDEHGTAWSIVSNQAKPPNATYAIATLDAGDADVSVTATVDPKNSDPDLGLVARVVDGNNFLFADVVWETDHWLCRAFQRVAGAFTGLTSLVNPVVVLGSDHTTPFEVTMTVAGSAGEVFISDVSQGTWSSIDASLVTPTDHGLVGNQVVVATFEDITIEAA